MPNVKLTKRTVEKQQPGERDTVLWDTDLIPTCAADH